MIKWFAAATIAVIVLLAILWLQIRAPGVEAHASVVENSAAPRVTDAASRVAELKKIAGDVGGAAAKAGKLDPRSDAFFYKFDEAVPPALTAEAAKCYTGGLHRVHRNAKVKLGYKLQITDGIVSVADVKVVESTVNDKTLEDCFVAEVSKVSWRDDELPDWAQDDELVIRPERGMKKFTADNLAYEGDGPIKKLESAGDVAASRELPRD